MNTDMTDSTDVSGNRFSLSAGVEIGLCLCILYVPAMRVIAKFTAPSLAIVAVPLLMAGAALVITHPRLGQLRAFVTHPAVITVLILGVLAVITFVYPIADGLKAQMRGTDQDDCMISGATRLFAGISPYAQRSYFGFPCSPGPGWLILYAPFVLTGLYPFGAAAALALTALSLYRGGPARFPVVCVFLLSTPLTWELIAVGSDLVAFGCLLAAIGVLLPRAVRAESPIGLAALALISGLLATARVNFLVIPPLLTLYVAMHQPRRALGFGIIAITVALGVMGAIYLWDPRHFTPLHLIGKANMSHAPDWRNSAMLVFTAIISVATALWTVRETRKDLDFAPKGLLYSLAPGLIGLALLGLIFASKFQVGLGDWATYLMPLLPLACMILATHWPRARED